MITNFSFEFNYIKNKIAKDLLIAKIEDRDDLDCFKRKISKKYKIPCPSNIALFKIYHEILQNKRVKKSEKIEKLLQTRPIRSLSGTVNISVLTKPYPCPGQCVFCPLENGLPKSYLSGEPAVERAKRLKFDPFWQVKKRIEILELEGHPTDKIELRIIGGTWSYYPKKYQIWFIKRCFDACNNSSSRNIKLSQKRNEKAKHRIVSLSIETRPDFINKKEIAWLRELGMTMVELGVQSIYDDVLNLNRRGHGVKEIILATKLLKDAGFKVLYQMMPNLPFSNHKRDEKMFEILFKNPDFQPDYLKIYPCALLKESFLYQWYLKGKFKPYSKKTLITLLKKIKMKIPFYVRIQRIARDIPANKIIKGGSKISNLRQLVNNEMKKDRLQCRCIRCREVKEKYDQKENASLFRQDYEASGGKEIFLNLENKDQTKLYSLLRLRIPSKENPYQEIFPILKEAALIREIRTFGKSVPIFKIKAKVPQHHGFGKKLIKEAERISKEEFNLKKIAVISAIGTRDYFRKLGYKLKDTYMVKKLC